VIVGLARKLIGLLKTRDPLSEFVHLSKPYAAVIAARMSAATFGGRIFTRAAFTKSSRMMPHER
jgi:hypothetical protein